MSTVRLHITEMQALRREMAKAKNARVKVGILGNKKDRFDAKEKQSNPDIGLRMEFGEVNNKFGAVTPARSFLRMPLGLHLKDQIDAIGKNVFRAIILKRGILNALASLGAVAENTIQKAFQTGGWGTWPKLAGITIRRKGSSAILIDTAQLRKSITSKVVPGRITP